MSTDPFHRVETLFANGLLVSTGHKRSRINVGICTAKLLLPSGQLIIGDLLTDLEWQTPISLLLRSAEVIISRVNLNGPCVAALQVQLSTGDPMVAEVVGEVPIESGVVGVLDVRAQERLVTRLRDGAFEQGLLSEAQRQWRKASHAVVYAADTRSNLITLPAGKGDFALYRVLDRRRRLLSLVVDFGLIDED